MDDMAGIIVYKKILHATDLSDHHFDLCQEAVKFANNLGASIHFIHVIETPASLQWAQTLGFVELPPPSKVGAQTVMGVLGDALKIPPKHLHVEIGAAYLHILEKAKELGCDLIILGNQSGSGLPEYLGTTAHAVIHHAVCDVLTIKNTRTG